MCKQLNAWKKLTSLEKQQVNNFMWSGENKVNPLRETYWDCWLGQALALGKLTITKPPVENVQDTFAYNWLISTQKLK